MKCLIMRHFIWVFTVCKSTHLGVSPYTKGLSIKQRWNTNPCLSPLGINGSFWPNTGATVFLLLTLVILNLIQEKIEHYAHHMRFWYLFVCVDSLCLSQQFSVMSGQICLGWPSTKQRITFLAQKHNAVPLVRLEPTTPQSRVKHSITEPLCSLFWYLSKKHKSRTSV